MFFKEVSLFMLKKVHLVGQKLCKNSNIVKYFYNLK